jgi:acetyl esterase/lipase
LTGALLAVIPLVSLSEQLTKQTHPYKFADQPGNELYADVYLPAGAAHNPTIVFIHGGALMMGGRGLSTNAGSLLETMVRAGYPVVSIDYRLAPGVKLPAIVEDVQDACKWVSEKGPQLFGGRTNEFFVMGQSAGGYLALVAGYRAAPRPRAIVSFWGYGDIAGDWYSQPDPFYLKQPLVPREETTNGMRLYLYCRQQGLWPKVLTDHDPLADHAAFDRFCPLRNVSQDYPPTLLIHGTADTDVPYEQSALRARVFHQRHVPHQFITITNGGHGFGRKDAALASRTYDQVVGFLKQHRQ